MIELTDDKGQRWLIYPDDVSAILILAESNLAVVHMSHGLKINVPTIGEQEDIVETLREYQEN